MKNQHRLVAIAVSLLVVAATPANAHHSFAAQYDASKPVQREGTVTKLEWTNPHAFFYIDVKDAAGATQSWQVELGSPNTLLRYGWKRNTLQVGDVVVVDGFLGRYGTNLINAKTVKWADGREVNAGSSANLTDTR